MASEGESVSESVLYPTAEATLRAPTPVQARAQMRLLRTNPRALTSTELLSLVLTGSRAPLVARSLLHRHGLRGLRSLPAKQLVAEKGMGVSRACRCVAVFEIARRTYGRDEETSRPRLSKPKEVYDEVRDLGQLRKEHLVGLYLDAQNGLIHRETLSVGSLNTIRTHPREILHPAIVHLAFGFILAHNHPSGCLEPSEEDIDFTRAVQRAGELMGIELYDHLIVAGRHYTSLRERGAL